jgi:eukaryotic-like serine/threonine-protein kinase
VKRIHIAVQPHSGRELRIADYLLDHNHLHVIPILDAGREEETGHHFIVMAKADRSLQDLVNSSAPLAESEAVEILDAITAGLGEIGEIVHRDLKPGNVLLHNGVWKLADLGLARFVEDATSAHTMKECMTLPYAAPEQLRFEHATKAADIYALGCILHTLLTGRPPFSGPTPADFSRQHQFEVPPQLQASDRLRQLASACLAKSPEARPTIASVRERLNRARQFLGSPSPLALANAAAKVAEERAKVEAELAVRTKAIEDRKRLAAEAMSGLEQIIAQLFESVRADAPDAEFTRQEIKLGCGRLFWDPTFPFVQPPAFDDFGWDVVAGGRIGVVTDIESDRITPRRSANLLFGKLADDEGYRWWEASFMKYPAIIQTEVLWQPFCFDALGKVEGKYRPAANPRPIDGEYADDFCYRWSDWLAKAVENKIRHPHTLPEENIDPRFYRQLGRRP